MYIVCMSVISRQYRLRNKCIFGHLLCLLNRMNRTDLLETVQYIVNGLFEKHKMCILEEETPSERHIDEMGKVIQCFI